jgi:predicted unusual protein kinase regulating ubiquinone biosynthesis (AarF/ABC1/UbiB family)
MIPDLLEKNAAGVVQTVAQLGLDHYTDVTSLFVSERNAIKTQEDLNEFQDRWSNICKEMHTTTIGRYNISDFLEIRNNQIKQDDVIKDPVKNKILNLIAPRTLLEVYFVAKYYNVPTGCALIQILNKEEIDKNKKRGWVRGCFNFIQYLVSKIKNFFTHKKKGI